MKPQEGHISENWPVYIEDVLNRDLQSASSVSSLSAAYPFCRPRGPGQHRASGLLLDPDRELNIGADYIDDPNMSVRRKVIESL